MPRVISFQPAGVLACRWRLSALAVRGRQQRGAHRALLFSVGEVLPVLGVIRRNGVASDARLSQQILLDFACWRSGQSLGKVDLAWYLEFGQPTDQIFAN